MFVCLNYVFIIKKEKNRMLAMYNYLKRGRGQWSSTPTPSLTKKKLKIYMFEFATFKKSRQKFTVEISVISHFLHIHTAFYIVSLILLISNWYYSLKKTTRLRYSRTSLQKWRLPLAFVLPAPMVWSNTKKERTEKFHNTLHRTMLHMFQRLFKKRFKKK